MNEKLRKLWHTKCEKDYKSRHFWERLGVVRIAGDTYLVWRCSQCEKCVYEELEFLIEKGSAP